MFLAHFSSLPVILSAFLPFPLTPAACAHRGFGSSAESDAYVSISLECATIMPHVHALTPRGLFSPELGRLAAEGPPATCPCGERGWCNQTTNNKVVSCPCRIARPERMPEALTPVPPPSNWVNWTRHTPKSGTSASSAAFVSKLDGNLVPGPLPHKALAAPSTPATQVCRRRRQPPDCPHPASLRARNAPSNPRAQPQAPPRSPTPTVHRPPHAGAESQDEAPIGPHVALGRERRAS